jgi:hypothetical protein
LACASSLRHQVIQLTLAAAVLTQDRGETQALRPHIGQRRAARSDKNCPAPEPVTRPRRRLINDQPPDFTKLDDSALLSARAQMRAELERLPLNSAAHAALVRVYDTSTAEVNDRARRAWARAK